MTISVVVRYHNVLRTAAAVPEDAFDVPAGTSLLSLLKRAADWRGDALRDALFEAPGRETERQRGDEGRELGVAAHLVVFCNRRLVPQGEWSLPLADGDEILLFPAVSGG